MDNPEVEILVGSDNWGHLVTGRPIVLSCGLVAVHTVFGWTLSGAVPGSKAKEDSVAMTCTSLLTGDLNIPDMWSLESIGIQDCAQIKRRKGNRHSTTFFENSFPK